jgi:hypothetical protein
MAKILVTFQIFLYPDVYPAIVRVTNYHLLPGTEEVPRYWICMLSQEVLSKWRKVGHPSDGVLFGLSIGLYSLLALTFC